MRRTKIIAYFVIICIFIIKTIPSKSQQRVTISPFYSDFITITDSAAYGWSIFSPFIQVSTKVEFPYNVTLDELKNFKFQNPIMHSNVLWGLMPVNLTHGNLRWDKLTLLNWNNPTIKKTEQTEIGNGNNRFCLYYNDINPLAGNSINKNNIPSMSYIHNEYWGSLFPRDVNRKDSLEIIFDVNPSLFYLLTDNNDVDLYGSKSVVLSYKDPIPSFYLFYRPVYDEKYIQHNGMNIRIIEENEALVEKLVDRICPEVFIKKKDSVSEKTDATTKIDTEEQIKRSLNAISEILNIDNEKHPRINIVKTGLHSESRMGKKDKEEVFRFNFSLCRGNNMLIDSHYFYSHTLTHEMLHMFIPGIGGESSENISPQEYNFLNESLIEYLARLVYGKYITKTDLFLDEEKKFNKERIRDAKNAIMNSKNIEVHPGDKMTTSEVFYDILPYLVHKMALKTGKNELDFAKALILYMQTYEKNRISLKTLFSFLRSKGFKIYDDNDIQKLIH